MYPPGTNITNGRREAGGKLVLDIEIPLQNVIPRGLPFN